ncbi:MAG: hypothetical protein WC209_11795 [Ignavibacteriaceae bacterium]|jgi:hypothetical protein
MQLNPIKITSAVDNIINIIDDVYRLIEKKEDYIAFIIIAIGIEFLGAFYDDKEFTDFSQSEIRFCNGLKNLFKNNWYKQNQSFLFKSFRGPLIHQYRIGSGILLTSNCKNGASIEEHLKTMDNDRVFVLEGFFEDFKDAADKFRNSIKGYHSLNPQKTNMPKYMGIYSTQSTIKGNSDFSLTATNNNVVIKNNTKPKRKSK